MRSIRWLAALAAPLVILIFAALSLLRRDAPQYHGTLLDPPLPAHDFTLQSADGPVRLKDLRGDYVAVFFGYTSCPDVCPMTLARLATALRALGPDAQGMRVVMITVDPERDTPERLAQYTAAFGPEFIGLTGTPDEIASVAARFGIFYARAGAEPAGATATADEPAGGAEAAGGAAETAAGYLVDHSATVTVLDPEGRPRLIWSPTLGAEELAEDMRTLLRGRRAAARKPAPEPEIWVMDAWARPTALEGAAQENSAAYLVIQNRGAGADRLIGVETDVANAVELHRSILEDGIMRMRRIDALEIPARGEVVLEPGGYHVMLIDLKAPLAAGDAVPLTLRFERTGEVEVRAIVGVR